MAHEALVLVRRKRRTDGIDQKVVEVLGPHEAEHDFIDVGEMGGAEFLVPVDLEVSVR